jgi:hypothetical protein
VADVQPPNMRIGDTERESALAALGEHMSAGRLDIDEYGERTAKVSAAKTRGELTDLFADLPQPHPTFGPAPSPRPEPQPHQQPAPVANYDRRIPVANRVMSAVVPLAFLGAVALFILYHFWMVFLIPVAITIVSGAIFGDDRKRRQRMLRDQYREQRRDMRRGRDDW